VEDFKVKFYTNGTPKEYTSILTIIKNGTTMLTQAVEVNHPLKYKGIKFYQSGYGMLNKPDIQSVKYFTELQIGTDPGIFIIWVGSGVMIIGMFLSFYFIYKRIWIRLSIRNNQRILEFGAKSYKDRAGFDREFSRLKSAFSSKHKTRKQGG